jgi:hypothetical protein
MTKTCSKCGAVDRECGFRPGRCQCRDCERERHREYMREDSAFVYQPPFGSIASGVRALHFNIWMHSHGL